LHIQRHQARLLRRKILMISFTILGSGSGGNAALLRSGEGVLMVDAGLSAAQLTARLARCGVDPSELRGILLTHEHGDHTRGLEVFTRKHRLPILANAMTREVLHDRLPEAAWKVIPCGGAFPFAGFEIESFRVPHDAVDPMGFIFRHRGAALGLLSDLGHVTALVRSRVAALDALFIEANYDCQMLANDTKRTWSTRQRIGSRHGHLSNDQCAEVIAAAAGPALRHLVLGHLSRDCNSREVALGAARAALLAAGCSHTCVTCASQDEPTEWLEVWKEEAAATQTAPATAPGWEQGLLF
jgi:phosphoribosyl 1,2-cyclic phosphodiesterase